MSLASQPHPQPHAANPTLRSPLCTCSLPSLLKVKGRPAWEAVQQPLQAALAALGDEAQVRWRRSTACPLLAWWWTQLGDPCMIRANGRLGRLLRCTRTQVALADACAAIAAERLLCAPDVAQCILPALLTRLQQDGLADEVCWVVPTLTGAAAARRPAD